MLIAICSDSHDNLVNIDTFLAFCNKEKVDVIFHCGDWCAPSVLTYFRDSFAGSIYGVYGNVHGEAETITKFSEDLHITMKEDKLPITLEKIRILLTHYPDVAKEMATTGEYDLIFYGHNHKPWQEKIEKTYLVNPGTLAGMFYRASFATYDTVTKKMDLKILDQM